MSEKFTLTKEQKQAKRRLERALQNMNSVGLSFISVCGGTSSSLKVLTDEALEEYYGGSHAEQCKVAERCERIDDYAAWEGELVP
ncbi:hypothetical protein IAD21_00924 [Abditibacteriota bacterium]|nr:hypothetical protein IAD21_00924 [Abditibacteriota bacterium]